MDIPTTVALKVALEAVRKAEKSSNESNAVRKAQETKVIQRLAQALNAYLKARGARAVVYSGQPGIRPMQAFTFKADLAVDG